jgi:hypothetical protein
MQLHTGLVEQTRIQSYLLEVQRERVAIGKYAGDSWLLQRVSELVSESESERERVTERDRDRQRETEREREREREKESERETETERERD